MKIKEINKLTQWEVFLGRDYETTIYDSVAGFCDENVTSENELSLEEVLELEVSYHTDMDAEEYDDTILCNASITYDECHDEPKTTIIHVNPDSYERALQKVINHNKISTHSNFKTYDCEWMIESIESNINNKKFRYHSKLCVIRSKQPLYDKYYPIISYADDWDTDEENEIMLASEILDELHEHVGIDLLGLTEVAKLLGWKKEKLSTYIGRGVFPEPVHRVAATPLWRRKQIEDYQKLKTKD